MSTDPIVGIVGIPCSESARHSQFWWSLQSLVIPTNVEVKVEMGSSIAANRNAIIEYALSIETVEWMLFLDDDHVMRSDTIARLLVHRVDVVSALYLSRTPPFMPLVFDSITARGEATWKKLKASDRGLIHCAAVPAGGLLIRRRVLELLPRPFFRLGQIRQDEWGDDLDFCRRVRDLGFCIYCDLDLTFGHLTTMELRPCRTEDGEWLTMAMRGESGMAGKTWR